MHSPACGVRSAAALELCWTPSIGLGLPVAQKSKYTMPAPNPHPSALLAMQVKQGGASGQEQRH